MRLLVSPLLALCALSAQAFDGQDAYGPGVHSDATGRPYTYDQPTAPGARIQRDAYGLGTDMDETGRPLKRRPRWAPNLPLIFRDRGGDSAN